MELGDLSTGGIYRERVCVWVFDTESVFDGSSAKMYFTTKATQRPHKGHTSFNKRLKKDQTKAKES